MKRLDDTTDCERTRRWQWHRDWPEEDDGTVQHRGKVESSVSITFWGRPLPKVTDHHSVILLELEGIGWSCRYKQTSSSMQVNLPLCSSHRGWRQKWQQITLCSSAVFLDENPAEMTKSWWCIKSFNPRSSWKANGTRFAILLCVRLHIAAFVLCGQ